MHAEWTWKTLQQCKSHRLLDSLLWKLPADVFLIAIHAQQSTLANRTIALKLSIHTISLPKILTRIMQTQQVQLHLHHNVCVLLQHDNANKNSGQILPLDSGHIPDPVLPRCLAPLLFQISPAYMGPTKQRQAKTRERNFNRGWRCEPHVLFKTSSRWPANDSGISDVLIKPSRTFSLLDSFKVLFVVNQGTDFVSS